MDSHSPPSACYHVKRIAVSRTSKRIDWHMSGMTDDVVEGKVSEGQFRKTIAWLVGSRLAGTVLAQMLIVCKSSDAHCLFEMRHDWEGTECDWNDHLDQEMRYSD